MKRFVVVLAALGLGTSLAGCGNLAAREASALKLTSRTGRARGVDVWKSVERIFPRNEVTYRENVEVNPFRKNLAITLQDTPAPYRVGEPKDGETSPLTFENAARNLVKALGNSRELIESDLTYDDVEELATASRKVVLHAREAVEALELKDRELKAAAANGSDKDVAGVWAGKDVASEEDEARELVKHWMSKAKLIEHNAATLWAHAATHRKSGIEDWSVALFTSCRELEKTYPDTRRRRRRSRATAAKKADEKKDEKEEPEKTDDKEPAGDVEEGPAKAETPAGDEHPETGSGSPPPGKDGTPRPDAGPPQVGAFLLGVAGRRRYSRSRKRAG
jgi:hypothetical protein